MHSDRRTRVGRADDRGNRVHITLAVDYRLLERLDAAARHRGDQPSGRRQLSAHPDYAGTRRWLAAALGQLGRTEEARAALEQVIAQSPGDLDVHARNRVRWMRPEDHEHMLDGLRKAGWQG